MTRHEIEGEVQLDALAVTNQQERSRSRCKKHIEGKKEKVLPWILSICSQTCLRGRFLIISVIAFSAICRSFSPPVPHPVCELYQ